MMIWKFRQPLLCSHDHGHRKRGNAHGPGHSHSHSYKHGPFAISCCFQVRMLPSAMMKLTAENGRRHSRERQQQQQKCTEGHGGPITVQMTHTQSQDASFTRLIHDTQAPALWILL